MGELSEFPLPLRLYLRSYPWRRIDPVPWAPLAKPLAECRLALVSSAGLILPDQEPFSASRPGGDPSFRVIPADVDPRRLICAHRSQSFDPSGLEADANLAFPIERLRELGLRGRIAGLAARHLSFMGSITAPGRLVKQTAPEAAQLLEGEQVDAALLVPV